MKLSNTAPKKLIINVRCNEAEQAMIKALQKRMRPSVSMSKLIIYLCEEMAKKEKIIQYNNDGTWDIDV